MNPTSCVAVLCIPDHTDGAIDHLYADTVFHHVLSAGLVWW